MNDSISVRHILAPVDLAGGSMSALRYVRFLARSSGARVTIFYAYDADGLEDDYLHGCEDGSMESAVRHYVDPFFDDLPYDVIVACADPALAVPRTAREIGADLIIMGSLSRAGAARAIAGAFA